jgi:3-dehydroquinate synthase
VVVGEHLLGRAAEWVAQYCPAYHYAVITDSTVGPRYAETLARALRALGPVTVAAFPAGERNKTRQVWADLTDQLLAAGVGRDGAVVALGGGVVGDVAGFVAATYLRGIPYVQVPTTLLAMIDSSIGGKTGVDTPAGKNLVGAFHQPKLVIADLATLESLPPQHLAAGMAEAIKHGTITDRTYFAFLEQAAEAVRRGEREILRQVVEQSVAIKAAIVAQDEHERGRRAILNFGHTIAHALEAVLGYGLSHGEAVAMGMAHEARLGVALGLTEPSVVTALREVLGRYDLPTAKPPAARTEALLEVMARDKKNRAASVRFALPAAIGKMHQPGPGVWTIEAPEEAIRMALERGELTTSG